MADQFKKAQRAINKYSRRLEQQRMGGLSYSLDAVNSIYANLLATQKGIAQSMTSSNDRTLSRLIAASQRNAVASAKAVSGAASQMTGSYGGLYGGQVAQQMDVAKATSEGVATAGKAGVQTAKGLAKAGSLGMAIQQTGVADAQAAAQYALAQASSARARADADAIAQMQAELELQKLSQAGGALSAVFPGLDSVSRTAASYSKEIRSAIAEVYEAIDEANQDKSPTDAKAEFTLAAVVERVMQRLAISPDSPEQALVQVLAQELYARKLWYGQTNAAKTQYGGPGTGRQQEIEIVTTAVMRAYDGNVSAKDRAAIENYVKLYLSQIYGNQNNPTEKESGNYGMTPPPAAPAGSTTTTLTAPDSMYSNSPNAISQTEMAVGSSIVVPTYAVNFAAGVELYMLMNPGATKTEAQEMVRRNLDSGGETPNYVKELEKYKTNN